MLLIEEKKNGFNKLKTPEKLHGEKETLTPSCRGKLLSPIKHSLH